MTYYDVTVPISESTTVWPGDPPVRIERVASTARGDELNLTRLRMSSHTGTHVDAPYHFHGGGQTVDQLPPELLVGPAIVASLDPIAGNTLGVEDMARLRLPAGIARLLLKTRNSAFWHDSGPGFQHDYVHLGPDAAHWVVERGIRVLGIDYLSVEGFDVPEHIVHRTLLGAGLIIIEGLDLSQVPAGPCQLICLPLKIAGGDGAPARVLIARE